MWSIDKLVSVLNKLGNVSGSLGGLEVKASIPNKGSIESSLDDYEIIGLRSIPISYFKAKPSDLFYAKNDFDRVSNLAEAISGNGYISPLIVVFDFEGPYILEGAHRLAALYTLGVKEIPALVVLDTTDIEYEEDLQELKSKLKLSRLAVKKVANSFLVLRALKGAGVGVREPFYHTTSYSNALKILATGFKAKAGGKGNDAYYDNALCFTRNFEYTLNSNHFGGSEMVFILDRAELKTRYKVYPYNYFNTGYIAKGIEGRDGAEGRDLFLGFVKGLDRRELFKLYLKGKVDLDNPLVSLDAVEKKFGPEFRERLDFYDALTLQSDVKRSKDWEFEERVSRSGFLEDADVETVIPPKYIKAVLIKKLNLVHTFLKNNEKGIPILYYDVKTKRVRLVESMSDIKGDLTKSNEALKSMSLSALKEFSDESGSPDELFDILNNCDEDYLSILLSYNKTNPDLTEDVVLELIEAKSLIDYDFNLSAKTFFLENVLIAGASERVALRILEELGAFPRDRNGTLDVIGIINTLLHRGPRTPRVLEFIREEFSKELLDELVNSPAGRKLKADEILGLSKVASKKASGESLTLDREDEDEYTTFNAFLAGTKVGDINVAREFDAYSRFEDDMDEDDYLELFPADKFLALDYLQVNPAYRGKGVAKALVKEALGLARSEGFKQVYLNASPASDGLSLSALVNLYKSFGFEELKREAGNVEMILNL